MKTIYPNTLFDTRILNYMVKTKRFGKVPYVNLDNAATTPPFLSVEKGISEYLRSYGSVHRGAGTKSKISHKIGVPLTRSGRQRKAGQAIGCCVPIALIFGLPSSVIILIRGLL